MPSKAPTLRSSRPPAGRGRRSTPLEVTAIVAERRLSVGELKRIARALAAEGFGELRAWLVNRMSYFGAAKATQLS